MTSMMGGLTASLVISFMDFIFTEQEMNNYAWRIPFLSSFIIGILGIISQKNMEQSHDFVNASKHSKIQSNPIKKAVQNHWIAIVLIAVCVIPWWYVVSIFVKCYVV